MASSDLSKNIKTTPLDFYIENGLYVFTEAYHLKRGTCCKNNCRHCPWKHISETTVEQKIL